MSGARIAGCFGRSSRFDVGFCGSAVDSTGGRLIRVRPETDQLKVVFSLIISLVFGGHFQFKERLPNFHLSEQCKTRDARC